MPHYLTDRLIDLCVEEANKSFYIQQVGAVIFKKNKILPETGS